MLTTDFDEQILIAMVVMVLMVSRNYLAKTGGWDAKTMTDCRNWRLHNFPFTIQVETKYCVR